MIVSVHCSQLTKSQSAPAAAPQHGACKVSMLCIGAGGTTPLAKNSHMQSVALQCEEAGVPQHHTV